MTRTSLLLITSDELLAASVRKSIKRYVIVRWARSPEDIPASTRGWCALVLDLNAYHAPFQLVQRLRRADPTLPALALAAHANGEVINAAQAARVELVTRPSTAANLVGFVIRALVSSQLPHERVCAWVAERAQTLHLTPRDVQLIAYALGGESRQEVLRHLGITENTLKTQTRSLLRKFGAPTLDGLAIMALREALRMTPEEHFDMFANESSGSLAP